MDLSLQGANSQDEEFFEYNNQLRTGIIDAFSGMLQGLGRVKAEQHLQQQSTFMVEFIGTIVQDKNRDENVTKVAVGLLGDIASSVPSLGQVFTSKPWIKEIIEECYNSEVSGMRDTAEWAATAIRDCASSTATS